MDFWYILYAIDSTLFVICGLAVLYMTVFIFTSLFSRDVKMIPAKKQNRIVVLIPAYKSDLVIEDSVKAILGQTYPQRLFDVTVISDHQDEMTNFKLAQYPITLLTPNFTISSKAKSLQMAINNLPEFKIYDLVVILDADNIVLPEFLQDINDAYELAGTKAIQAHRVSKNRDTPSAILDSTFEEINNTIFRRGHIRAGLSAAILGSGIVFDFRWFKENIMRVKTAWEDKELEARLARQNIFVDYFDNILVFDEKTRRTKTFNKQRSRWATTQFHTILSNIRFLPFAILNRQYDLIDKIIQWMLIPRTMMMGIILFMCITLPWIYFTLAVKWWGLIAWTLFVFATATPDYLVDKNWSKAFFRAPIIMLVSIFNMTKLIRGKKHFFHKNYK